MEQYRLIATINNTADTFTILHLPENFEGVKISQKFSFTNPIGYTPKFSVDTMRIIKEDKAAIDVVFDTYGLESDVTIEIQRLKSVGFGYDSVSTFAIDFESYEKFDYFSEFALKSISAIDFYNRNKSSEIQVELTNQDELTLPIQYVNQTSLRSQNSTFNVGTLSFDINFVQNGEYKLYNDDTSLVVADTRIYEFGSGTSKAFKFVNTGEQSNIISYGGNMATAKLVLCKNNLSTIIYTVVQNTGINSNSTSLIIPTSFNVAPQSYNNGDFLFFAIILTAQSGHTITSASVNQSFYFTLKKETDTYVLDAPQVIQNASINQILDQIFDNNTTSLLSDNLGVTSANALTEKATTANFKPSDFLGDISRCFGLIVNFKKDSSVYVNTQKSYFDTLLSVANAIEITDFKDISIKSNKDLAISSVQVGHAAITYKQYIYSLDWIKILSFIQTGRLSGDTLNISLQKFRSDFLGIIENLKNKYTSENSTDLFIIDRNFAYRTDSNGELIYDVATSRDSLVSWKKFLSFAFQNFGKDTLTISSNGGTEDNLTISGVAQMDDLVLAETPRLLPIEYNFTALIGDIDFSEKILKLVLPSETVYLFVVEAETTDKLTEQKIKALKIQF
jgi:hypothetical protein